MLIEGYRGSGASDRGVIGRTHVKIGIRLGLVTVKCFGILIGDTGVGRTDRVIAVIGRSGDRKGIDDGKHSGQRSRWKRSVAGPDS